MGSKRMLLRHPRRYAGRAFGPLPTLSSPRDQRRSYLFMDTGGGVSRRL
jgi:hypothetical protein